MGIKLGSFETDKWIKVISFKVKEKSLYNLDTLYELLREWFIDHEYCPRDDEEFPEILYKEEVAQDGAKNHFIWWRFEKQAKGVSDIFYKIDVTFLTIRIQKAEVVVNGKKYKTNKGECEINITAKIKMKTPKQLQKGIFALILKWLWQKGLKEKIRMHFNELHNELYELQNAIKEYYQLNSYKTAKYLEFEPKRGYLK